MFGLQQFSSDLGYLHPVLDFLGLRRGSIPSAFWQFTSWDAAGDSLHSWVPVTPWQDMDRIPSSQLQVDPAHGQSVCHFLSAFEQTLI